MWFVVMVPSLLMFSLSLSSSLAAASSSLSLLPNRIAELSMPSSSTTKEEFSLFDKQLQTSSTKKMEEQSDNDDEKLKTSVSSTSTVSTSTTSIPTITIGQDIYGTDVIMPLVGAGTWQYNDTTAYESICSAFSVGYTFVDTAFGYHNQKGVGAAIRDCWKSSREELFVMTKIPGGFWNTEEVWAAHKQNLMELQLDYVDHLMVHFPSDWEEHYASPTIRQEQWLILEEIYKSGEARSIGISHYCPQHINDILKVATILPTINQVEYHVGSQDIDHVRQTCEQYGIVFMSFSPLCGPCDISDPQDSLIDGTLVTEIASHYTNNNSNDENNTAISGSQVALRFIVQQGIPVIPKSHSKEHLASNLDIFRFELTDEDMEQLAAATKPAAEGGDCDVP